MTDVVKQPSHYTSHPSGVECIEITKHMSFTLGSAMKYIWRCDLKKDAIEDLKKAQEYLRIEIDLRESVQAKVKSEAKATTVPAIYHSIHSGTYVPINTLARYGHVHDRNGVCMKNRDGLLCK